MTTPTKTKATPESLNALQESLDNTPIAPKRKGKARK